jgi:hypothetical protein
VSADDRRCTRPLQSTSPLRMSIPVPEPDPDRADRVIADLRAGQVKGRFVLKTDDGE